MSLFIILCTCLLYLCMSLIVNQIEMKHIASILQMCGIISRDMLKPSKTRSRLKTTHSSAYSCIGPHSERAHAFSRRKHSKKTSILCHTRYWRATVLGTFSEVESRRLTFSLTLYSLLFSEKYHFWKWRYSFILLKLKYLFCVYLHQEKCNVVTYTLIFTELLKIIHL